MKNSRGWNSGSVLRIHPLECSGHEHPEAQDIAGILNFEADLGGANIRIHDGTNTGDPAFQNPIGISVQMNIRILSDVHRRKIVLIHIADDPHLGRIGNREQVGRIIQALDSGRGRYVLFNDGSTRRRLYFDQPARLAHVRAQHAQPFRRIFHHDLGLRRSVLGDLDFLQRDRALPSQELGTFQLLARQFVVRQRLPVVGERLGDIGALNPQQELALGYNARINLHHAARSQRNHRDVPRYIGGDGTGHSQLRGIHAVPGWKERKLVRMIHLNQPGVIFVLHGRGRRSRILGARIHFASASTEDESRAQTNEACQEYVAIHWITSCPTARFS